jgi:hypothetical protein
MLLSTSLPALPLMLLSTSLGDESDAAFNITFQGRQWRAIRWNLPALFITNLELTTGPMYD